MRFSMRIVLALAVVAFVLAAEARADASADEAYVKAFAAKYPPVEPVPTLAEYATVERYDAAFLGADLDRVPVALAALDRHVVALE